MEINLHGKTAIVTGATGELGRVIALTLAECGADIVLHYHSNREKADELQQKIQALGRRAIAVKADITDKESIMAMRDLLIDRQFRPDIVVDNAVVQYVWKPVLDQEPEDYESQFRSCVMQNVFMAKAFVPHMIEQGGGRFIGINTECAMQMQPTQSAYVAGKRGMDGVLKVLAREIGQHNITVNEIAPGWTISEKDRAAGSEHSPEYEKAVPLRRRGTDQEIANAVAFIASDLASFITGAYIPVSGGNVMPCI
jgi:Dehydrogenases with different specificities (related to short-chain alcohol dehydrogenases)